MKSIAKIAFALALGMFAAVQPVGPERIYNMKQEDNRSFLNRHKGKIACGLTGLAITLAAVYAYKNGHLTQENFTAFKDNAVKLYNEKMTWENVKALPGQTCEAVKTGFSNAYNGIKNWFATKETIKLLEAPKVS